MIDEAVLPAATRRRGWLAVFVLFVVVAAGFLVGRQLEASAQSTVPSVLASASASVSVSVAPPIVPPAPVLEAAALPPPTEALQLPGAIPEKGSGSFTYASGHGKILGTGGPLRRFRVAVEKGSGADPAEFAADVEAILGDARSWTGGGSLRLQRVGGADAANFTVHLATRVTAGQMCARGGTNIRISGRPYTSCRTSGKAIINLDRWRLSAKPYVAAKAPLEAYRQYVINHEVGHELGHRHEGCPKAGSPAPVMVQQTITLRGCLPYSWPRRGSGFLTGPRR
ncbi:MAG: DUF3152 domain-containing protein [Actinoplanes sp.]